jgi:hypothetical protein
MGALFLISRAVFSSRKVSRKCAALFARDRAVFSSYFFAGKTRCVFLAAKKWLDWRGSRRIEPFFP